MRKMKKKNKNNSKNKTKIFQRKGNIKVIKA